MASRSALSSTEARVFRAYWQDGLLDLLAGSTLMLIGAGWLSGFVLAVVVVPPIALVLWPLLRQRVTRPRLGDVRFNAERRFRMRHGLIAVVSLGVLLFGFVGVRLLRGEHSAIVTWLAPGIPAFILAALALSAAEALRLLRFAVYGAALLAAGLVVAAVDGEPGWAILAGGTVAVANGTRLLGDFLHRFPPLPREMDR